MPEDNKVYSMSDKKDPDKVYRLKVTRPLQVSARKQARPSVYFDWDNKEDALAAKALLEKAKDVWPGGTKVEFLVHVPDMPLE